MRLSRATQLLLVSLVSTPAWAQDAPAPAEVHGEPVSSLMFFTLGITLVILIGGFAWFLRSRSNRAAADRALNPKNPSNQ
jgi:hypothetical protein